MRSRINHFKLFIQNKYRRKMEKTRRCEVCKIDVHRASYAKHLKIKKRMENMNQKEVFIPEWFFKEEQEPFKRKIKKVYNPKTIEQIARENVKTKKNVLKKISWKNDQSILFYKWKF